MMHTKVRKKVKSIRLYYCVCCLTCLGALVLSLDVKEVYERTNIVGVY
jgi:hypothetical protein